MKINPLLSGALLFSSCSEDSLCIDNALVPIIVQTLSIGTRGPDLCVNAYCQFAQQQFHANILAVVNVHLFLHRFSQYLHI